MDADALALAVHAIELASEVAELHPPRKAASVGTMAGALLAWWAGVDGATWLRHCRVAHEAAVRASSREACTEPGPVVG